MKTHQFIHGFALASLAITAIANLSISRPFSIEFDVAVAVWAFLLWKLWLGSRNWMLVLAILLTFMISGQIILWERSMAAPMHGQEMGRYANGWYFALLELPLGLAALFCWLRWVLPTARCPSET